MIKLMCNAGLGDVIYSRVLCDHIDDHFKICLNLNLLKSHRSIHYINFMKWFMDRMFCGDQYDIVFESDFQPMCCETLWRMCNKNIKINYDYFKNSIISDTTNIPQDYIVLFTKIRDLPKNIYDNIKHDYFKTLNQLSHKYRLILLGEKQFHGHVENLTYVIYDDIINNVKNILDCTVDNIGFNAPNIDRFSHDWQLISNASHIIMLGIGGSFCMSSVLNQNLHCLRSDQYKYIDVIFKNNNNITKNSNQFFDNILSIF